MTMTFGAHTELSRCIAASTKFSCQKSYITHPCPCILKFNSFLKRLQPLSITSGVGPQRSRKSSITLSMSSNNNSGNTSTDGSHTYKDVSVDIDAGSELVRRIVKMVPVIGGFGGLFSLGTFSFALVFFVFVASITPVFVAFITFFVFRLS